MDNVYAIRNDGFNYKEFTLKITDIMGITPEGVDERKVMKFSYFNIAMADWWKGVKAGFKQIEDNPPADIPDIYIWRGASAVLSPKAYTVLKEILSAYGELLPVECEGETYYLFNCMTSGLVDEINSEQDIQNCAFTGVKKIKFNTVDIEDKLVFKTQFDRTSTIYCRDEFKSQVESNGLTGIIFKENLENIF